MCFGQTLFLGFAIFVQEVWQPGWDADRSGDGGRSSGGIVAHPVDEDFAGQALDVFGCKGDRVAAGVEPGFPPFIKDGFREGANAGVFAGAFVGQPHHYGDFFGQCAAFGPLFQVVEHLFQSAAAGGFGLFQKAYEVDSRIHGFALPLFETGEFRQGRFFDHSKRFSGCDGFGREVGADSRKRADGFGLAGNYDIGKVLAGDAGQGLQRIFTTAASTCSLLGGPVFAFCHDLYGSFRARHSRQSGQFFGCEVGFVECRGHAGVSLSVANAG